MKCPICNGKTEYFKEVYNDGKRSRKILVECDKCNGTGYVDMTNDEWRRTCSVEEFAEWLRGVYWHCHEIDCEHCNYPWRCMEKGDIVEWLKQPHTKKE